MRNTCRGRAVVLEGRLGEVRKGVGHGREGSFRASTAASEPRSSCPPPPRSASRSRRPPRPAAPAARPGVAAQRGPSWPDRSRASATRRSPCPTTSTTSTRSPPRSWRPPTPRRRLRVGSLTYGNDYRHPVVLAKEAATIDLLSGGRFELGLGAGLDDDRLRAGRHRARPTRRPHRPTGRGARRDHRPLGRRSVHRRGRRTTRCAASTASRSRSAPRIATPARATDPDRRRRSQDPHPGRPEGRHHRPQHRARRRAASTSRRDRPPPTRPPSRRSAGSARPPASGSTTSSCRSGCTWPPITDDRRGLAEAFGPALGLGPEEAMASPHALAGSVVGDRRAVPRAARALRHQLHRARGGRARCVGPGGRSAGRHLTAGPPGVLR